VFRIGKKVAKRSALIDLFTFPRPRFRIFPLEYRRGRAGKLRDANPPCRSAGQIGWRQRMADPENIPEARHGTRYQRRVQRAVQRRQVLPLLIGTTFSLTLIAAILMTLVDHSTFHTLGQGIWWAVQTLTTVGYGDILPQSTAGRVLAGLTMLLGITFIAFLTATVTSTFVSADQRDENSHIIDEVRQRSEENNELLARIEKRLDAIEDALEIKRGDESG
jgi:voltage-gated potassium channel